MAEHKRCAAKTVSATGNVSTVRGDVGCSRGPARDSAEVKSSSSATSDGPLDNPVAIAAFEGWNDAAEAASGVVNHLGIAWQSTPIAAIDPDDFYDFQVNRPVIEVVAGKTERLVWPTTRLSLARASATGLCRDIVLVHGVEPNMRWRGLHRRADRRAAPSSGSRW